MADNFNIITELNTIRNEIQKIHQTLALAYPDYGFKEHDITDINKKLQATIVDGGGNSKIWYPEKSTTEEGNEYVVTFQNGVVTNIEGLKAGTSTAHYFSVIRDVLLDNISPDPYHAAGNHTKYFQRGIEWSDEESLNIQTSSAYRFFLGKYGGPSRYGTTTLSISIKNNALTLKTNYANSSATFYFKIGYEQYSSQPISITFSKTPYILPDQENGKYVGAMKLSGAALSVAPVYLYPLIDNGIKGFYLSALDKQTQTRFKVQYISSQSIEEEQLKDAFLASSNNLILPNFIPTKGVGAKFNFSADSINIVNYIPTITTFSVNKTYSYKPNDAGTACLIDNYTG